jgi:hypothetical protein
MTPHACTQPELHFQCSPPVMSTNRILGPEAHDLPKDLVRVWLNTGMGRRRAIDEHRASAWTMHD